MPGRFALYASAEQLADIFGVQLPERVTPRYNISPSQQVAVIRNFGGENHLDYMKWGLVPSWADDTTIGYKLINARSETVFEKNSFKRAIRTRRCLIPISGFYEWQSSGSAKVPFYISMADNRPLALAGIWEQWKSPDGVTIETCAILTTTPNRLIETIHDRMPVILHPQEYSVWLDREISDPASLKQLFKPYPAEVMTAFQVSSLVNSVRNDGEDCILKVDSNEGEGLFI